MEEFERWELFIEENQRTGVLYRRFSDNVLLTRVTLGESPSLYRAESRIRLTGDHSAWELSWFRSSEMDEPRLMLRKPGTPEGSMPGYGEFLMLRRLLESGASSLEFTRLGDEGVGRSGRGPGVGEADLVRLELAPETEMLEVPHRAEVECLRVDVHSGGKVLVRHWVHADRVVASDWGAAMSYRVPGGPADAGWISLEGLDEGSIEFLTQGFDG
ncbi:hypothetical protein [Paeniglutamicibacter cryotolerans]|uniref:DUF3108 domain-containing protein n=1 Tax=Paeniglutamicibacter cryotolerans TaxID=670079 RepID=A0A839QKH3_9MICC|nr:hypothetical protein [Paeniglutamicibacter cryotolerans]MBB2996709.1 hypothetical protein [Paeniglutamicibacter cryotolerans]